MEQSPLAAILGHLTQMSDRQTQLQQTQNEVLLELGQSLTADRAVLQELLVSSNREREPRAAGAVGHIHIPKMGETDDAEAFLETFRGVAEVSGWPRQEWAHRLLPLLTGEAQLAAHSLPAGAQRDYEAVDKATPPVPGPHLCRRRSALHLRPAAAGPGEEVVGPGEEQPRGDRGAGGPREVRRGAPSQNIHLGPIPPAREPLGGRQHRGGPPDSPLDRQKTTSTNPEPADRCGGPAGVQTHPATKSEVGGGAHARAGT